MRLAEEELVARAEGIVLLRLRASDFVLDETGPFPADSEFLRKGVKLRPFLRINDFISGQGLSHGGSVFVLLLAGLRFAALFADAVLDML